MHVGVVLLLQAASACAVGAAGAVRPARPVRTVQRKFREQRESKSRRRFIFNLVSIQRRVKYWLGLVKRRRLRQAASVVISFLQGTARLSPMARAMHRYALRVRIMQRFARGYLFVRTQWDSGGLIPCSEEFR